MPLWVNAQQVRRSNSYQKYFLRLPYDSNLPTFKDGRHYPIVPSDPELISDLLTFVEEAIHDPKTPNHLLPRIAHQQQVIYRALSNNLDQKLKEINAYSIY